GATAVLAQAEYVEAVDTVRPELPALRAQVVIDHPPDPSAPRGGWLSLRDLTARAAPPVRARHRVPSDHDLWQMYTSGTTGRPKGAVLTHASVGANAVQFQLG